MFDNRNDLTSFILNILTIIFNVFTCLISTIVLICIIAHQYSTRVKNDEKTLFILAINIYFYILSTDIIQLLLAIYSLLGDLYNGNYDSPWCILNGYLITVLFAGLYYSFVVQVIIDEYPKIFFEKLSFLEYLSSLSDCLYNVSMFSTSLVIYNINSYSIDLCLYNPMSSSHLE